MRIAAPTSKAIVVRVFVLNDLCC